MSHSTAPYAHIAHALAMAREACGLQTQAELAARIGVTQQSVSRWEAGTHRPRPAQLAALATLLNLKIGNLLLLAGYEQPTAQSLLAPLPVDRLDATSFEQFVAAIVAFLYPGAQVRRLGGQGHTQGGSDIVADLPDGRCLDLQCKRMARFGPGEVTKVVKAYSRAAHQKIIVLSRVASPQAADAVRQHPGWTLWDKDDLTRKFRHNIAPVDQDTLVNIYFPGQHLALLGRSEPGVWLSADRFFAPFSSRRKVISHEWRLVGRDNELAELLAAVSGADSPVSILVGAGGIGKSRLLREFATRITQAEPGTTLRFLDRDKEISQVDLEALGPGPKLIVVDDAHDRDRLGLLFAFVADVSRQARVLISTRQYALARIRQEAATYSVTDIPTVILEPLRRAGLVALAEEVLTEYDADRSRAAEIVASESDSPLATVLFARAAGLAGVPPELARGAPEVQDLTAGRFRNVLLGEFGHGTNSDMNRDVLEVLALVQPFHPEDPALLDLLNAAKQIGSDRVAQTLRRLIDGGIVFRRGSRHRLMPDLLGDCLIEDSCMTAMGGLTPFAEKALRAMPTALLPNALVNLGRLDWRRAGGNPADSRFLDHIWRSFHSIKEEGDPRLEAAKAVAVFQPRQALDLVGTLMHRGRRLSALGDILRGVAHHTDHLPEVCDLLWRLGRDDRRELHSHPGHPLRILVEAGEYSPNRRLQYSQQIIDFALGLIDDAANWRGAHDPLTLLKPLMQLEGQTTRSTSRAVTFTPFYVRYEAVEPIRKAVIDRVLALLTHCDVAIACRAGEFVGELLHGPIGISNTEPPPALLQAVRSEAGQTLRRIARMVSGDLAPPVVLTLARVAAGQRRCLNGSVARYASSIIRGVPDTLEFRLLAAIGNGSSIYLPNQDVPRWHEEEQAWLGRLVIEIRQTHRTAERRHAFLERGIETLSSARKIASSHHLAGLLLHGDKELQLVVVNDALARPDGPTAVHAGSAMMMLMAEVPREARALAHKLVESGKDSLVRVAAAGYHGLRTAPSAEDFRMIRRLMGTLPSVIPDVMRAVTSWPDVASAKRIELFVRAGIEGDPCLADELASVLCGLNKSLLDHFTASDARQLLATLEPIPALNGYWVDELVAELSRRFPSETADFLMHRVERASAAKSYAFIAANHGPYGHRSLGFLETHLGEVILDRTWTWMLVNCQRDHVFRYAAGGVFKAMFLHDVAQVIEVFGRRLPAAGDKEIELMAAVLRNADPNFVFAQAPFVERLLERRAELNPESVDRVIGDLFASAISGVHSGIVGEPMPHDVSMRDQAEAIIKGLSRASAAYPLYDSIRTMASENINSTLAEREELNAE